MVFDVVVFTKYVFYIIIKYDFVKGGGTPPSEHNSKSVPIVICLIR